MEGGHIIKIENVDIKTFQTYKDTLYKFAFDKNYFFEQGEKLSKNEIKELDLKKPKSN